jgi:hypothetical protein
MRNDHTAARCAEIYNLAWWIRYRSRPAQKVQRRAAVCALGLAVRQAFRESDDFEPLLAALADALAGAWPPARL